MKSSASAVIGRRCRNASVSLGSRGWDLVPTADTAGAARELGADRKPDGAVIASERAATLYGLEIAARGIQDDPHNVTRFAVIAAFASTAAR